MKTLSFAFLILSVVLSGCASGGRKTQFGVGPGDDVWEKSRAHPASYGSGNFSVNKNQPIGEKTSEQFYYKNCEEDGNGSWFSKTSYSCNER